MYEPRDRPKRKQEAGDPAPLTLLLDTFDKSNAGDRTLAECLVMPVVPQSMANTTSRRSSPSSLQYPLLLGQELIVREHPFIVQRI
jgi:hypothetical protein